jgi:ankyrin repeat protein
MHVAARDGNAEMIELLAAHGARIDRRGLAGRTPLHRAVISGEGAVRALLKLGADRDARDDAGHTPAELARLANDEELAKLIDRFKPASRPATLPN